MNPTTIAIHKNVTPNWNSKAVTSDAKLYPSYKAAWLTDVQFGKNQIFRIQLDSGSSDTWVRGPDCLNPTNDGSCDGSKLDLSDNSIVSFQSPPLNYTAEYADGNFTADVYTCPVQIGTLKATIPIGVARVMDNDYYLDGLLGFGFVGLSSISRKTKKNSVYFDNLGFTKLQEIIGFYISNFTEPTPGQITFGGIDSKRFYPPIHYMPVIKENGLYQHWAFSLVNFTVTIPGVNSIKNVSLMTVNTSNAIIDTGTTQIKLDKDIVHRINVDALGAKYNGLNYQFDCDVPLPDIIFNDGDFEFILPSLIYRRKIDIDICFSVIVPTTDETAVFGDYFLSQYYSIFDKSTEPPRIGLAKANHQLIVSNITQLNSSFFVFMGIGLGVLVVALLICVWFLIRKAVRRQYTALERRPEMYMEPVIVQVGEHREE
ncbi:aspartic peptidase domain-containing protein [Globomyces pollinis-pini]|nr:aspartic peptidase domain-containing protein [Globomyces pollinis-pini]